MVNFTTVVINITVCCSSSTTMKITVVIVNFISIIINITPYAAVMFHGKFVVVCPEQIRQKISRPLQQSIT